MFRTFTLVAALCAALVGFLTAFGRESRRASEAGRGPDRSGGRVERCLTCHDKDAEDPGGAHARAALGCSSCHLGNALAFGKTRAHEGLEKEPGALSTVERTCGRPDCHAREAARVATSPMTRNAGIVAVDRFAFGEIPAPDGTRTIAEVLGTKRPTPAEDHLRKLCAGCHLGTRRANRDDQIHGNGSGCAACHVERRLDETPRRHPPVDSRVTDDRCEGCHSGSGRIALSYRGLVEVEKGKPYGHAAPDVHRAAGMACIDCHLHTDLMGDGTARTHEEDQVEVTCEACHGPMRAGGEIAWADVKDEISKETLGRKKRDQIGEKDEDFLRGVTDGRAPDAPARLGRRGVPLLNLLRTSSSSSWVLVRKLDGIALPVKQTPRDRNHTLRGHERLTCSSCHSAWTPTCNSCHISFDPSGRQWDFAEGREAAGGWVECSGPFAAAPPLLGVRADGKIGPAQYGMVLEVDATGAGGAKAARRLLAPAEPHTTGKRARTCESCHRAQAPPEFEAGTRPGFRPLDAAELHRIATSRFRTPPPR